MMVAMEKTETVNESGKARLTTKGIPIPISFTIAVVMTLALFIFFGAWAVSADAEGRERTFSFAIVGPGAALLAESDSGTPGSTITGANRAQAGANQAGSNADTWWGKSFLRACPLH